MDYLTHYHTFGLICEQYLREMVIVHMEKRFISLSSSKKKKKHTFVESMYPNKTQLYLFDIVIWPT